MFNYINYNSLNAILILTVLMNSFCFYVKSASAETINKLKSATPTVYFTYDGESKKYIHYAIDGSLVSGAKARVVYDLKRKNILFKNNNSVYLRYSFDFWKTCQDVELKSSSTGELCAIIKIPENATTMQTAFFATYPYDNYKSWGFLWDSNYGENFKVNLISKKELAQKEKFEALNAQTSDRR